MIKQIKWFFKLEYLLLFLVAFELFYKHHFVIFALFIVIVLKSRITKDAFNRDFLWVVLWGVSYFIFGVHNYSVAHVPALLCAFLIGFGMLRDTEDVFRMLFVIAVGYGLEGLLTIIYSGGVMSFAEDEATRSIESFWGSVIGLTAQNAIMFIFSGLLVYILTRKDVRVIWKIAAILFELGFVYDSLRIASRSPLVYCPIIIIVSLIVYNGQKMRLRSVVTLLTVVVGLFIAYESNLFGVKSTVEDSFLFTRIIEQADGGAAENGRFRLQARFWDVWNQDMWGGLHDKINFYFHNTWLDMYAFSGVLGFITFVILTIRFIVDFIFVYRRTDSDERSILAGVFTAFMLPMYFEPLYWGAPAYFAFFFIFFGMISKRKHLLKSQSAMHFQTISLAE